MSHHKASTVLTSSDCQLMRPPQNHQILSELYTIVWKCRFQYIWKGPRSVAERATGTGDHNAQGHPNNRAKCRNMSGFPDLDGTAATGRWPEAEEQKSWTYSLQAVIRLLYLLRPTGMRGLSILARIVSRCSGEIDGPLEPGARPSGRLSSRDCWDLAVMRRTVFSKFCARKIESGVEICFKML